MVCSTADGGAKSRSSSWLTRMEGSPLSATRRTPSCGPLRPVLQIAARFYWRPREPEAQSRRLGVIFPTAKRLGENPARKANHECPDPNGEVLRPAFSCCCRAICRNRGSSKRKRSQSAHADEQAQMALHRPIHRRARGHRNRCCLQLQFVLCRSGGRRGVEEHE